MKEKKVAPPKEFTENVYVIQDLIKKVPELYKAAQREWNDKQKEMMRSPYPYYEYGVPFPPYPNADLHIWSCGSSISREDPE